MGNQDLAMTVQSMFNHFLTYFKRSETKMNSCSCCMECEAHPVLLRQCSCGISLTCSSLERHRHLSCENDFVVVVFETSWNGDTYPYSSQLRETLGTRCPDMQHHMIFKFFQFNGTIVSETSKVILTVIHFYMTGLDDAMMRLTRYFVTPSQRNRIKVIMIAGHGDVANQRLQYSVPDGDPDRRVLFADLVGTFIPFCKYGIVLSTCAANRSAVDYETIINAVHQQGKWVAAYQDSVKWVQSALTEMSFLSELVANGGLMPHSLSKGRRPFYSICRNAFYPKLYFAGIKQ